jgi:putative nucleotidyltransferase-like protein
VLTGGRLLARLLDGAWREEPPPAQFAPEDLRTVAPLALRGGVGALLWRRLRGSAPFVQAAARDLRQAHRLYALEAAVQRRTIAAGLAALRAEGLSPLLGKGWAMARLYPETGLRPAGDVDLYVPPAQAARARACLRGAGVDGVDLHAGAAELDDRPWEERLERAERLEVEGTVIPVFGAEDHLRLVALHLLRHGGWRPLWLCDVAVAVEALPEDADWDRLLGRGRRADAVGCALALARDVLGARLERAPEAVRVRVLPPWIVPALLRPWGDPQLVPQSQRRPWAADLRRPATALRALLRRWPGPVEATANLRAPFNRLPRLPFQVAECVRRTSRFAWIGWR